MLNVVHTLFQPIANTLAGLFLKVTKLQIESKGIDCRIHAKIVLKYCSVLEILLKLPLLKMHINVSKIKRYFKLKYDIQSI